MMDEQIDIYDRRDKPARRRGERKMGTGALKT
jgi:hypothetical protein